MSRRNRPPSIWPGRRSTPDGIEPFAAACIDAEIVSLAEDRPLFARSGRGMRVVNDPVFGGLAVPTLPTVLAQEIRDRCAGLFSFLSHKVGEAPVREPLPARRDVLRRHT